MAVKGLYALQNGFIGFEKTGLFFGERSAASRLAPCPGSSAPIP